MSSLFYPPLPRPFLRPKEKQEDDALAVEATSYALLTLFLVEGGGVTILQDQVSTLSFCVSSASKCHFIRVGHNFVYFYQSFDNQY